jgi:hypothetical protein
MKTGPSLAARLASLAAWLNSRLEKVVTFIITLCFLLVVMLLQYLRSGKVNLGSKSGRYML